MGGISGGLFGGDDGTESSPFGAFFKSPIGQTITGNAAQGDGQKPGFFGLLNRQAEYWDDRESSMTPTQRSRRDALQQISEENMNLPAAPEIKPFPAMAPGQGSSLLNALEGVKKRNQQRSSPVPGTMAPLGPWGQLK